MDAAIRQYLREVGRIRARGDATEHSYRPALKTLVEGLAPGATATNEPQRVRCGAPDLVVTRGPRQIGHIECKDVGIALDDVEQTDQLQRYFKGLHNLVLTDYLEFRYYVAGEQQMHVRLARTDAAGKVRSLRGAAEQLTSLFRAFDAAEPAPIVTPRALAQRLADVAKIIRRAIELAFGAEGEAGTLHGQYEAFRKTILPALTPEQFADMYAQTVCYGLFSARVNVPDHEADAFTREHAARIPPRNRRATAPGR